MKVVIIGNNVAGTFTAQNLRSLNEDIEIEVFTQEQYPYYTRIKLPELIPEKVTIDSLIVFKEDWYDAKRINLHLNKKAVNIDPKNKSILFEKEDKPVLYDKLILALGSTPNIPPIKNAREMKDGNRGVFTLRTIDDALQIRDYIEKFDIKKAIVIGGGLLGLELANQLKDTNLETTVVEFFPRLLPRQLDEECGTMLKNEIESRDIKVVLDATTEEILGNGKVSGIKLKDGRIFEAGLILIQAGIRLTIDLAKNAGIETNRGIIVNEFLETSEKDIYAVGDCVEYKNQVWGIIPACMEQSKIVAASIIGSKRVRYEGTTPKNTLKIVGLELTSIGIIDPSKEESGGWEILKKADKEDCCYQKIILKDNKLKGAILFGENKVMSYIYKKMEEDIDQEELRKLLELYIFVCNNCGMEYDEAKMNVLFYDLPADFKCPGCGGSKDNFKKKE
ncbi:MAG: FAD-dependent oxidoreductase [Candidatus Lokiarchaeota archaeon]|nr:FAD-dependent oxidoreductase [Candidatus Lokiarchaeota archaeon]